MPRISTPRKAASSAERQCNEGDSPTRGRIPNDAGLAKRSWWIGLSRERMAEELRAETQRMQFSKFGRVQDPTIQ